MCSMRLSLQARHHSHYLHAADLALRVLAQWGQILDTDWLALCTACCEAESILQCARPSLRSLEQRIGDPAVAAALRHWVERSPMLTSARKEASSPYSSATVCCTVQLLARGEPHVPGWRSLHWTADRDMPNRRS